jgi:2-oxo-3-hexenedioate decarboxylase
MQDEIFQRGMQAQLAEWQRRLAAGEQRVGWKMGYMDTVARLRLGLPYPMVGFLTSGRLLPSGGTYRSPAGANLLAESEVALQLGHDIPPGTSAQAAQAAIAALAPAIEIVDVTQSLDDLDKILAGNLFHAAVVLGRPVAPKILPSVRDIRGGLKVNGVQAAAVDPASLPQSPGEILVLVAQILDSFGVRLCAGDWVITGSVIKPSRVSGGDKVELDMGLLGQASVVVGP